MITICSVYDYVYRVLLFQIKVNRKSSLLYIYTNKKIKMLNTNTKRIEKKYRKKTKEKKK